MSEYICLKCTSVFSCNIPKCCGYTEPFNPVKHARLLLGGNNAWVKIKKEWDEKFRKNELIEESSRELTDSQCFSSATHIIIGIEKLIEFYDESIGAHD